VMIAEPPAKPTLHFAATVSKSLSPLDS